MIYKVAEKYSFENVRDIFELNNFDYNLFINVDRISFEIIDVSEHRKKALKDMLDAGAEYGVDLNIVKIENISNRLLQDILIVIFTKGVRKV